jgi:hypothetical protein
MIYDLPSGYSIVFIPKNGSSSVKRALNWDYDNPPPKQKWHNRLAIPDEVKGNLVAILRDPVERFLSCCSYLNWKVGKKEVILDPTTYMSFHGRYPHPFITWHMRAQIEFVQNPDWFAKLYYLSEIDEFFSDHRLGELHCCNKTSPEYKIKPTQEIIEWVQEAYKEDYELLASIKPKHRSL